MPEPDPGQKQDDSGDYYQNYYQWQMSTLMLAYDLADPIAPEDHARLEERRDAISEELGRMVRELLPPEYLEDPERDFPPELMMRITRATLKRAAEVAGL